jgi:alpha-ketoglutarate-dependent taurine dioxygenase
MAGNAQPRFRGVARQSVPAASSDWVGTVGQRQLPLEAVPRTDVDLAAWARDHADMVTGWLNRHGAVLFRGFAVDDERFAAAATALAGPALPYRERSSPRTEVRPGVYTSTDYPADQAIALHNENSYQRSFPSRLVFGCLLAPEHGGETPLADCRRVLSRLSDRTVSAFRARQVRYVRNYTEGAGLSWQEAFQETDPGQLERYCHAEGIDVCWQPDGRLRTEQVRPALAVHPLTKERVWFNHAAFFHISGLDPSVRAALLAQFGPERLPVHACYGDGADFDSDVLAEVGQAYTAEAVAVPWRQGDVLLVDNLLVAHGRAPYDGARRVVVSMAGPLTRDDLPSFEEAR